MDCSLGIVLEALPLYCLLALVKLLFWLYFIEQISTHNIEIHFQDSHSKAYKILLGNLAAKSHFWYMIIFFSQKYMYVYISAIDYLQLIPSWYRLPSAFSTLSFFPNLYLHNLKSHTPCPVPSVLLGSEMFSSETSTAKPVESVNTVLNFLLIIHQSGLSLKLPFMFICQLLLRPFITQNPSTWRSCFYRPLMSLPFAFSVMCAWRYSEGKRAFGFLGESHAIMSMTRFTWHFLIK